MNKEIDNDLALKQYKLKKIIEELSVIRKNETSVLSIYIPPKKAITETINKLNVQYAESEQIKDKVNKASVQESIKQAIQLIRKFSYQGRVSENGLVIFCGENEKKIQIVIEPYRPLDISLYNCDFQFQIQELKPLLQIEPIYGFIIMDGNGCLFATLQGNSKQILKQFEVDLPKKHNKGGQSSLRFSRLRQHSRHNYLKKVCAFATNCFINYNLPTVKGLILGGFAEFKNELFQSQFFDYRLKPLVISLVDISYGGQQGLQKAIDQSCEILQEAKYQKERQLISKFFESINLDTGMTVYGVEDTMRALQNNLIKEIICCDNLSWKRVVYKNDKFGDIIIKYFKNNQIIQESITIDNRNNYQVIDIQDLIDYLCENYKNLGILFQLVTDSSSEGNQFSRGFGGIAGFYRFKGNFESFKSSEIWSEEDDEFI